MFLSQYILLDHFDLNFLRIFRWFDNVFYTLIKHNFTTLASLSLIFIQNVLAHIVQWSWLALYQKLIFWTKFGQECFFMAGLINHDAKSKIKPCQLILENISSAKCEVVDIWRT